MSVLENFKNIPWSPYGGRQGSNVIFFFFKFATKSLKKKKEEACRPPTGDRTLSPTPGATDPYRRQGGRSPLPRRQGEPVGPPTGDRVSPPYIRPPPSFPPHLTSKNPPKIQKKERGEEKGSGEALPNSALVIYR